VECGCCPVTHDHAGLGCRPVTITATARLTILDPADLLEILPGGEIPAVQEVIEPTAGPA